MTQKLTLNFGLRWDYRAAAYEAETTSSGAILTNPQGGLCYADQKLSTDGVAPGVGFNGGPILRYCGSVPHPGSKKPFAPRFGFAYRLNDKTVVRGGYGIFFDSAEGREIDDSADIYPYSIRNNLTPTTVAGTPKFSNQLFPSFSTLGPFPESTLSFIAVIESENPMNPYVQSWNLSVERETGQEYDAGGELHRNPFNSICWTGAISLSQSASRPRVWRFVRRRIPSPATTSTSTQAPCTVASRLPYPNFNGFYIDSDWHGYSHYNAMNIKFEHRAGDLAVTSVFTWAKSLDDKSAAAGVGATGTGYQGFMNNHDPTLDYGPSDFDVDHRFVASFVYQLPIGRGKKLAGGVNRAARPGGWRLGDNRHHDLPDRLPIRHHGERYSRHQRHRCMQANYMPGCDIHSGLTRKFQRLNAACFTQPALGTYGDIGRNTLRQPGINNWDMGFGKSFELYERLRFALKMDAFNIFNHHQYNNNVGGLLVAGSGGASAIDNTVGDTKFGLITTSAPGRILQFSGKLTF